MLRLGTASWSPEQVPRDGGPPKKRVCLRWEVLAGASTGTARPGKVRQRKQAARQDRTERPTSARTGTQACTVGWFICKCVCKMNDTLYFMLQSICDISLAPTVALWHSPWRASLSCPVPSCSPAPPLPCSMLLQRPHSPFPHPCVRPLPWPPSGPAHLEYLT